MAKINYTRLIKSLKSISIDQISETLKRIKTAINNKTDISNGLNAKQADNLFCAAKGAQEALTNLEALFQTIMNEADEHSDIRYLARLGNFHAMEQASVTNCMIQSLRYDEIKEYVD